MTDQLDIEAAINAAPPVLPVEAISNKRDAGRDRRPLRVATDADAPERPDWLPKGFQLARDGSINFETEGQDGRKVWQWLCSPLQIHGKARTARGTDWALGVSICDSDDNWHDFPIPMAMLSGSGEALRAILLSLGLRLSTTAKAREAFNRLLLSSNPKTRLRSVRCNGWHGTAFKLPDETIGHTSGERLVFVSEAPAEHAFGTNGTLEGWKRHVAALCVGNSRLTFSCALAFAAALVKPSGQDGGGCHFRGNSSTGKTSMLRAAGSVWGGDPSGEYFQNWRATANGLEGVAAMHCDALLGLDEMGQADAESIGASAYMLANGVGKVRAAKDGQARPPAKWRLLFISTCEISLAQKASEGFKRPATMAGQEVRIVDLPADAEKGLGLFDHLHGRPSGSALADELKDACRAHFGHAARAFIEYVAANYEAVANLCRTQVACFVAEHCPADADGQVKRVAARFGLIALAGELATRQGITGWPTGEAEDASAHMFAAWLETRGGTGSAEMKRGIETVRAFIDAHGASRFVPFSAPNTSVHNRAGWRRDDGALMVFTEAWKSDVLKGQDAGRIAAEMIRRGMLETGKDGKSSLSARDGHGVKRRFYVVLPSMLEGGE